MFGKKILVRLNHDDDLLVGTFSAMEPHLIILTEAHWIVMEAPMSPSRIITRMSIPLTSIKTMELFDETVYGGEA